jgi:hypothetical protein
MNSKARQGYHEVPRTQRKDFSNEEIKQVLEQVEKEEKHQKNLVEQQKKMKDESPKPQLKPETPEETVAHEEKISEGLAQLRRLTGGGNSIASNQRGLEAKAIPVRAKEGLTNQSREDFLHSKMEKLGQEAAAFQAKLVKELADIKAPGGKGFKEKILEMLNGGTPRFGDNSLDDGQDKNKKSSTGDLGDDQDPKSPKPQKKVDDGSSNVYNQLSYAQSIDYGNDYGNKSFEPSEKVSWSEPSEKVSWRSKGDADGGSLKAGERQQVEGLMHRTVSFLSKKEKTREDEQILRIFQELRRYQKADAKGEEIPMDRFRTAIKELDERLQEKELEKRREQTEKQSQQVNMELQQKANGPSGTVGEAIEQKITESERGGSRGKKS